VSARDALIEAHEAKASADRAVTDAESAALSARSHLDATIAELADHRHLAEAAAADSAEALKASLKSGGGLIVGPAILPEREAARIAVERRHDVARRALAGLEAEPIVLHSLETLTRNPLLCCSRSRRRECSCGRK
jgi:hypothetical protein